MTSRRKSRAENKKGFEGDTLMWSSRIGAPAGSSSVRRTSYGGTAKRASARAAAGRQGRSAKIALPRGGSASQPSHARPAAGERRAEGSGYVLQCGLDGFSGSPDYTGAPIIKLLNGIARGDDINERNGRQVIMKSVQINMVFRPS